MLNNPNQQQNSFSSDTLLSGMQERIPGSILKGVNFNSSQEMVCALTWLTKTPSFSLSLENDGSILISENIGSVKLTSTYLQMISSAIERNDETTLEVMKSNIINSLSKSKEIGSSIVLI